MGLLTGLACMDLGWDVMMTTAWDMKHWDSWLDWHLGGDTSLAWLLGRWRSWLAS